MQKAKDKKNASVCFNVSANRVVADQSSHYLTITIGYWHELFFVGKYRNIPGCAWWILVTGTLTNSEDPDEIPLSAFCRLCFFPK